MIERWFTPVSSGRPAYVDRLAALLTNTEIAEIKKLFERQLSGQSVPWQSRTLFLTAFFNDRRTS